MPPLTLLETTNAIRGLPTEPDIILSALGGIFRDYLDDIRTAGGNPGAAIAHLLTDSVDNASVAQVDLLSAVAVIGAVSVLAGNETTWIGLMRGLLTHNFMHYRHIVETDRAFSDLQVKVKPQPE